MPRLATPTTRPAGRKLRGPRGSRFTLAEQELLRQLYPTASWAILLETFTGRNQRQINAWAVTHGLARQTPAAKRIAARKAAPTPAPPVKEKKLAPATPVLDARVRARTEKEKAATPIGRMLEQMRRLPGSHPRRLAYANAARTGTGLDAFNAWTNWKPSKTQTLYAPSY